MHQISICAEKGAGNQAKKDSEHKFQTCLYMICDKFDIPKVLLPIRDFDKDQLPLWKFQPGSSWFPPTFQRLIECEPSQNKRHKEVRFPSWHIGDLVGRKKQAPV